MRAPMPMVHHLAPVGAAMLATRVQVNAADLRESSLVPTHPIRLVVLAGPVGQREVAPGRPARPAGAAAGRLLPRRRRPRPAPGVRHRRLGRPGVLGLRRPPSAAPTELCRDRPGRRPALRHPDLPGGRALRAWTARGSPVVIAEGIFAAEAIGPLRDAGLLADALCLTHRPVVTFARRLARDLKERRKPPLTLVRRGWGLMRAEPEIVARQVSLGATPCTPKQAERRIRTLLSPA